MTMPWDCRSWILSPGQQEVDANGKEIRISPRDCDRVFVDITAYNSRVYYMEGELYVPGRLPFTGNEHVLDVIHFAGGLRSTADRSKIRLIRSFPKGSPVQVLPIDYEEITMGTDNSTNYQILPTIAWSFRESVTRSTPKPESGAKCPRLAGPERRRVSAAVR